MPFGLGRIAYPLAIIVVVGMTWCLAWARSVSDVASQGYWPAKDPELMRRVISEEWTTPNAEPVAGTDEATRPIADR